MSIWIDKRGRRNISLMVGGKRVHRVMPQGASAGAAKQLEAELIAALGKGRAPTIPGDPPLAMALALYAEHAKTLRSPDTAVHHAQRIGQWAEKYRASEALRCAEHFTRDAHGAYKPATINRSLSALSKGCWLLWKRGLTPENYGARIERLPEHNARTQVLTFEQINALLSHCSEQVRAVTWVALYTGLRRREILTLAAGDIGADAITAQAANTKTLKTRVVPIVAPVRPWLAFVPFTITYEGVKSAFRRAREKEGLQHLTFRDLRRTIGTLMVNSGEDIFAVSKMLGHSSVQVTQRHYAHLQVDNVRAAMERTFAGLPAELPAPAEVPARKC